VTIIAIRRTLDEDMVMIKTCFGWMMGEMKEL
jgi:hypothetical protein